MAGDGSLNGKGRTGLSGEKKKIESGDVRGTAPFFNSGWGNPKLRGEG